MNRSLDDYLLPKAQWQARRTEYLQRADLLEVADEQPTLLRLAERLEGRIPTSISIQTVRSMSLRLRQRQKRVTRSAPYFLANATSHWSKGSRP